MPQMLDAPVLVLADAPAGVPAPATLDLLTQARGLTTGGVVALVLDGQSAASCAAGTFARHGATRVLAADLAGGDPLLAVVVADAVVEAAHAVGPAAILLTSDYRGKQAAGRAAVLLSSACVADAAELTVVDGELRASKLVLAGAWATTFSVAGHAQRTPVVCVRPGAVEATEVDGADAVAEPAVEVVPVALSAEARAVRVVSREVGDAAAGPDLAQARTVVVGGRGVDGDFDLVRSLALPLGAAVGATRVACDEGWIERTAQVGQTGVSIAPRLYIGLGVSGAVHHTSGIQGAGTVVAVCDDPEAPIFEMADFGVVGDVTEVVPQLVEELARLGD